MPRDSALLAALTSEPIGTSELYDRVGYVTLTRVGLVPYPAFRQELARLAAMGRVISEPAPDGSTVWRAAQTTEDPEAAASAGPTSEWRIDDP
jgi:hypothetical protein